uniref:tRNA(Ile)-lysidine synthase n=1 Tax=Rhodospora sordida TaxID=362230 RepID=UPI001FCD838C|nr:tRNA(Ile)-lysidine synthase [Rhodospora sordida]UNJ15021.1 tRNA(Ile)-lysidine synthase [Rhodospora sordida]
MSTYLHEKIFKSLTTSGFSLQNAKILLAVSGGKDSLCLLKIMKDLGKLYNWTFAIVHCNHQWRTDSYKNAHLMHTIANEFNVTFYLAINHSLLDNESKVRQWRYYILLTIAVKYKYTLILTAHNRNDKVETLFYNLSRGSGLEGIVALANSKKITKNTYLYRPLLQVNQNETSWFCRYFCLPVWSDITNLDITYKRNRIRQDLLPYLRQFFNPRLDENILYFLDKLSLQNTYFNEYSQIIYLKVIHPLYVAIHSQHYSNLHSIMQITIVRMILKQLDISSVSENSSKDLIKFLKEPNYDDCTMFFYNYIFIKKTIYVYFCKN